MKPLNLQTACPCCQGPLRPAALGCDACQLEIKGPIQTNEFASLPPEDLHLLRIFVWAEGRIRDMEAPLGLTYPTIRSRLAGLRQNLHLGAGSPPPPTDPISETLERLEEGSLDFDQALQSIRQSKKGKKP